MNDIQIAAGCQSVGAVWFDPHEYIYWTHDKKHMLGSAMRVVVDWRVAGALMEMVTQVRIKPLPIAGARWVANVAVGYEWSKGADDSLPRAIIEACVSALQEDKP